MLKCVSCGRQIEHNFGIDLCSKCLHHKKQVKHKRFMYSPRYKNPGDSFQAGSLNIPFGKIQKIEAPKKGYIKFTIKNPVENLFQPPKPMLAENDGLHLKNPEFIAEEKFDGTRGIMIKRDGIVRLFGRSGNEYTDRFPEMLREAENMQANSFTLDGELAFFNKITERDEFLTILARRENWESKYHLRYMVFDILDYNGNDFTNKPLSERKIILQTIIPDNLIWIKKVKWIKEDKDKFFESVISKPRQGEGIMLKKFNSTYQVGERSRDWRKVKGWKSDEAVVVGLTEGTGRRQETFGGLILAQLADGRWKYVATASGFTDKELVNVLELMKQIRTDSSVLNIEDQKRVKGKLKFWVQPVKVIEVKFLEKTLYGHFRHPNFLRFRDDKLPNEVIFKR